MVHIAILVSVDAVNNLSVGKAGVTVAKVNEFALAVFGNAATNYDKNKT